MDGPAVPHRMRQPGEARHHAGRTRPGGGTRRRRPPGRCRPDSRPTRAARPMVRTCPPRIDTLPALAITVFRLPVASRTRPSSMTRQARIFPLQLLDTPPGRVQLALFRIGAIAVGRKRTVALAHGNAYRLTSALQGSECAAARIRDSLPSGFHGSGQGRRKARCLQFSRLPLLTPSLAPLLLEPRPGGKIVGGGHGHGRRPSSCPGSYGSGRSEDEQQGREGAGQGTARRKSLASGCCARAAFPRPDGEALR